MEKRIKNFDEFVNEQKLNESKLSDDWNPEHDFGVFRTGGSIGEPKDGVTAIFGRDLGILVQTFENGTDAKNFAKHRRSQLSPGEKQYYGLNYKTKKLTPKEKEEIAKIIT